MKPVFPTKTLATVNLAALLIFSALLAVPALADVPAIDSRVTDSPELGAPVQRTAYVLGDFAFNITLAQQSCEDLGEYDLATWKNTADLDAMILLCSDQPSECFTRYLGNENRDAHISILDGSVMPYVPTEYWSSLPVYSTDVNVMVRHNIPLIMEFIGAGSPICTPRPLFADGFDDGTMDAWTVVQE